MKKSKKSKKLSNVKQALDDFLKEFLHIDPWDQPASPIIVPFKFSKLPPEGDN